MISPIFFSFLVVVVVVANFLLNIDWRVGSMQIRPPFIDPDQRIPTNDLLARKSGSRNPSPV